MRLRAVGNETESGGSEASGEEEVTELVLAARQGNGSAWARLYQLYFDRVYRDVSYLVDEKTLVEELVQETFATALTRLDAFDGRSRVLTWLQGIAHNLVRSHWRRAARGRRAYFRFGATEGETAGSASDPEALHLQHQRARVLRSVLEDIPVAWREAFILVDVQACTVAEAATRLGTSAGNIRVRTARARARIRQKLAQLGWLPRRTA